MSTVSPGPSWSSLGEDDDDDPIDQRPPVGSAFPQGNDEVASPHTDTIKFCLELIERGWDAAAVGRLARNRALPHAFLKDQLSQRFDHDGRRELLNAFAGSSPDIVEPRSTEPDAGLEVASALIGRFITSVKTTRSLMPKGVFDRDVIASAALLAKTSKPYLTKTGGQLRKAGGEAAEVDSWVRAVKRVVHGRVIRLLPAAEVMNQPDPDFLIDELIEENSLALVYGPSNVGKSFVVLDWCFSVAAGLPWLGRRTLSGDVVYISAEGSGGLSKRLSALVEHYGTNQPPPNFSTSSHGR